MFFFRNLNLLEDIMIAGVASAMWQLALPAAGIQIRDANPKTGSLASRRSSTPWRDRACAA